MAFVAGAVADEQEDASQTQPLWSDDLIEQNEAHLVSGTTRTPLPSGGDVIAQDEAPPVSEQEARAPFKVLALALAQSPKP